jgi:hypothetical protein
MTQAEMITQLSKLTLIERLELIEVAVQQIRNELQREPPMQSDANRGEQLRRAAELLRQDYLEDKELTAFSVLDGEDFYVEE